MTDEKLDVKDAQSGNYVEAIDPDIQYPGPRERSQRHRVWDNLPGNRDFCPLIHRTEKLERFSADELEKKVKDTIGKVHPGLLSRAAAFLLLKDSKASYAIEGGIPPENRAERWGKAIGQAGQKDLSMEELLRLQKIVIEDRRFVEMGWRKEGGFVGLHSRVDGKPVPDHIEWEATSDGNVNVLNQTIDLYRYFDATKQAEFLYKCVEETVLKTLPEEVQYLENHDKMRKFIQENFDMPDKEMENLIGFLRQNDGKLSKRVLNKEFKALSDTEVRKLEAKYQKIFLK